MVVAEAFGDHLKIVREFCDRPDGRAWLDSLPAIVADRDPARGGASGAQFTNGGPGGWGRAERADGSPAVLKISWPLREARGECTGLSFWDGAGAVRLLGRDDARYALLVERCEP